MEFIEQFKQYLLSQKKLPSRITVKNYKADIGQFIRWFEAYFNRKFEPQAVTAQIIELYKNPKNQPLNLSPRSLERHLSALRKFFHFLKIEGIISLSPFELDAKRYTLDADPWHLKDFKNCLYIYNASHLTIKNYVIDVRQFLKWVEEVTRIEEAFYVKEKNVFDKINAALLEEYKNRLLTTSFSPASVNRKLSSLRKYLGWAVEEGLIGVESTRIMSKGMGVATSMVKSQMVTSDHTYAHTGSQTYSNFPPLRLFQKVSKGINFLFDATLVAPLAKILEQGDYLLWKIKGKPIFGKRAVTGKTKISVSNLKKELYAPYQVSTKYFPLSKKIFFHLRHTRPKWYQTYHSYSITHYFHLAILIIFTSTLGFGLYQTYIQEPQAKKSLLAAAPASPPRILSFQGRLTDAVDSPITTSKFVRFQIYSSPTATGSGNLLWQEVDKITPDTDGIFSILLGNTTTACSDPLVPVTGPCLISQSLFAQNAALYLGVTIENDSELKPRQQLATVAYAVNAEVLQGMPPTTDSTLKTNANAILALNSSGTLAIGGTATTTFQTTNGQFKLTGQPILLTTNPGTNQNISIEPDGIGKIDLRKPLQNTSNNNNITTAKGSVEVDDLFSILATSSGQSALIINQNGAGPLISASTSGTAKFTVDNTGRGYFADSVGIGTTNSYNFKVQVEGSIGPNSDLQHYLGSSSKRWARVYANELIGGTSGIQGYWQRNSQALSPTTITDDLLLGATATASALVKLTGTSGNNSWINTGNVGIGDTSPASTLTVGDGDLFQIAGANGNITTAGDLAVNGADLTTSATTFNLVNTTTTTLNIGGAATTVSIGASTGTTTINNNLTVTGDLTVSGGDIGSALTSITMASTGWIGLGATAGRIVFTDSTTDELDIQTANLDLNNNIITNIGNAATDFDTSGGLTLAADLAVNGGDITSTGALNITSGGAGALTLDSASGSVTFATDDDLIPTLGAADADIGASGTRWDNIYAVAGNFSGTVTVGDLSCTDCLDFAEFEDTLDLDADLTLNQSTYTWTQNFTGATTTGLTYNANSLTSGKGVYVLSTSTGLTGNLGEIVLSGSNAANTGNVLRVAQTGTLSAAVPLMVTNLGIGLSFRVNDETGDTDTTPFVIDGAGNVGIGTTSPQRLLHLTGAGQDVSGNIQYGGMLSIMSNDAQAINTGGSLSFGGKYTDAGDYYTWGAIRGLKLNSTSGNADGQLTFYTRGAADGTTERMRITDIGNVGIGTTSPTAKLDIAGSASSSGTLAFRGTTDPKIDILNGENLGIRTSVGGDAGLSERLTILNSGNVGIGTTAPGAKLEVYDNSSAGILLNQPTAGTGSSNSVAQLLFNRAGANLGWIGSADDTYHNSQYVYVRGVNGLSLSAAGTGNHMFIKTDGSVGIGTTGPNNRLEVLSTTTPQLRVAYDTSAYFTTAVAGTTGAVTFDTNGTVPSFTFSDPVTANTFSSSGVTITGGSITGTTIGATNPSTGAFTTLTSSGNTTLGTGASGAHTYSTGAGSTTTLGNSTGALTVASGGTSAWTNTSGNLTIQTATSGTLALTSAGALNLSAGSASTWTLPSSTTALNIASGLMDFDTTNSRVGIGTTDPLAKLQSYQTTAGVGAGQISYNNATASTSLFVDNLNTASTSYLAQFRANCGGTVATCGSPTTVMLIRADGNVGIGTTSPSALLSVGSTSQFQVNSSGAVAAATGITSSGTITLSGLTTAGPVITSAAGLLSSEAQLAVARGGTGLSTFGGTNTILYTTTANNLSSITTANSGVLVTSGAGVPSIATDIPTAVTIGGQYIYRVGGTDVAVADGGTGVSSWTNGQLLIGNTTGNTAALATLTGTANQITVTNGASSITLSTPQDIATTSTPQFANLKITAGGDIRPSADSTTALNIANAAGTDFVTFDTSNSRVGIGTTSPSFRLSLEGTSAGAGISLNNTTAADRNATVYVNDSGYFSIRTNGANDRLNIDMNGAVGIGTTSPGAKLEVTGNILLSKDANRQISVATGTTAGNNLSIISGSGSDGAGGTLYLRGGNGAISGGGGSVFIYGGSPGTGSSGNVTLGHDGTNVIGDVYVGIDTQYSERLCHSGSDGTSAVRVILGDCSGGGSDLAEYYGSDGSLEPGDVVVPDEKVSKAYVKKSPNSYQNQVIGIVSTNPFSEILGEGDFEPSEYPVPIALAGRVPVKVSTENGPVAIGDPLTSSSVPGVAMRTKVAGPVVGKALEPFDPENGVGTIEPCPNEEFLISNYSNQIPNTNTQLGQLVIRSISNSPTCGRIMAFVNVSWYDPDVYLTDTGDLQIAKLEVGNGKLDNEMGSETTQSNLSLQNQASHFSLLTSSGEVVRRIGAFGEAVIANLRAGLISAQEITTNSLAVATENITISGQSLKDYITIIVSESLISQLSSLNSSEIISPLAEIDIVRTNVISPLASDSVIIHLGGVHPRFAKASPGESATSEVTGTGSSDGGKLIIENASGSAVASIDSSGNASFSGQLSASSGQFNNATIEQLNNTGNATIAGTLRAKNIVAESIEGLEASIAKLRGNTQNPSADGQNYATDSASFSVQVPLSSALAIDIATLSAQLAYVENLNAATATFTHGLMSFGPASFADVSVVGQFSVGGSLILADNSINVLGSSLELQPLKQGGISIMGGLVTIDTEGNLKVGGNAEFARDVTVRGNLAANIISPIPDQDLVIRLGTAQNYAEQNAEPRRASLTVQDASGSAVVKINDKGDLIASGSGSFADLLSKEFRIVRTAQADDSLTESVATSSAGTATITAGQINRTIRTPFVKETSLIYITAVTDTLGTTPYVSRQVPEDSFTIEIQRPIREDIKVNWLIIN